MTTNRCEHSSRVTINDYHKPMIDKFGERYIQYRHDWDSVSKNTPLLPFPIEIAIELIDYCNLKCIMCPRKDNRGSKTKMPLLTFKKLIDEGARNGLRSLNIGWGDEALLHKDIVYMASYASYKGIMDIRLTTNGTLLTPQLSRDLINAGVTFLSISIDAVTKETYKAIRGGVITKVENNVLTLLDIKGSNPLPVIRVSFIDMPLNNSEKENFIAKWTPLVNFIEIQDYIDFDKLQNISSAIDVPNTFFCEQAWRRLGITSNGNTYPCCEFQGRKMQVGNIYRDTLTECWHSNAIENIRQGFITNNPPPECRQCYYSINSPHNIEIRLCNKCGNIFDSPQDKTIYCPDCGGKSVKIMSNGK